MGIGKAFDKSVDYYDNWMKLALPSYEELFSIAVDLVPFDNQTEIEVLDLGAGTGLFSSHIFSNFPQASFVLCDLAPKMLDVARNRFQKYPGQFEYIQQDYRDYRTSKKFDLIISSLSIHHLTDDEKKMLFGDIYQLLQETGIFINVDQIKGPTQEMGNIYWESWLERVKKSGADEDKVQASIQRRTEFDKDALMVDQLNWLSEAGFSTVDCVYKNYFIGVFFGSKRV